MFFDEKRTAIFDEQNIKVTYDLTHNLKLFINGTLHSQKRKLVDYEGKTPWITTEYPFISGKKIIDVYVKYTSGDEGYDENIKICIDNNYVAGDNF